MTATIELESRLAPTVISPRVRFVAPDASTLPVAATRRLASSGAKSWSDTLENLSLTVLVMGAAVPILHALGWL